MFLTNRFKNTLLIVVCLTPHLCYADPEPIESEDIPDSQGIRHSIASKYLNTVNTLDAFFSGGTIESKTNKSFLKLESESNIYEHSASQNTIQLKARIDLPNTQKRWRLIYDSDLQESNDIGTRYETAQERQDNRSTSVAGFELAQIGKNWKTSGRAGVKVRGKLSPYYRLRAKREFNLSNSSVSQLSNDVWYLDGVGWGNTLHLRYLKEINDVHLFKTLTEIDYRDENTPLTYTQQWTYVHKVSSKLSLETKLAHFGEGSDPFFNKHFIQTGLKRPLFENWLYLNMFLRHTQQIGPNNEIGKRNNWEGENSISIFLTLFFTD